MKEKKYSFTKQEMDNLTSRYSLILQNKIIIADLQSGMNNYMKDVCLKRCGIELKDGMLLDYNLVSGYITVKEDDKPAYKPTKREAGITVEEGKKS